jgi:hypothetical protein
VNKAMKLRVPQNAGTLTTEVIINFPIQTLDHGVSTNYLYDASFLEEEEEELLRSI